MSPEHSSGYAKHIRREKEESRKEQSPFIIPSWATVSGMIDLRTHNNSLLNDLFHNNRTVLKEYYDARYAKAIGKGDKKLNSFIRKYDSNPKSKFYNPELLTRLSPLTIMVRDSFPVSKPRR